jgi:predicted helicase
VERAGAGIVAYICNHGFLDNPTFRGMRWNLLKSFDKIYIIDLHGNAKKKETALDGGKDENVFDIQQGVSINIFVKKNIEELTTEDTEGKAEFHGGGKGFGLAKVYHCDLYGLRNDKYEFLLEHKLNTIKWQKIEYKAPLYFFVHKSDDNREKYEEGFYINDLLEINTTGIVTARDSVVIDIEKDILLNRILKFCNTKNDDNEIRKWLFPEKSEEKYLAGDSRGWKLSDARKNIRDNDHKKLFIDVNYRPFDIRKIYYSPYMVDWGREKVMKHLINGKNIGLVVPKICKEDNCVFVTKYIMGHKLCSAYDSNSVFPLYLYEGKKRRPNLNPKIIKEIEQKLNLAFSPEADESEPPRSSMKPPCNSAVKFNRETFTPLNLIDYIYAVLHSPEYREMYKEFLKIDFPRIPYPEDQKTFWKLAALGGELRQLHLLESPIFEKMKEDTASPAKVTVEKIRYSQGKVFVNDGFCFEDVTQTAWDFYIGGYQPAQKWLKDRKGRVLKAEDLKHYRKIVLALAETARIMKEIYKVK